MRPVLTVAVIAKDEEKTLPQLFSSLEGISGSSRCQLIVVDTGSRDGTRDLAVSHGAEVHGFQWREDFSAARNHALSLARGEWILCLDADDQVPESTKDWLEANLGNLDNGSAYAFLVRSAGHDGTESSCTQIRLFPNGKGLRFRNPIHESIGDSVLEGGLTVSASGMDIVHTGYKDPAMAETKRIRNRNLLAKAVTDPLAPASLWLAWGRMKMGEANFRDAETAFRKALLSPFSGSQDVLMAARVNLGQSLCFQNRAAEALQIFEDVLDPISLGNMPAAYLLEYGKALWLNGKNEKAREAWTACLHAGPEFGGVPTDWETIRAGAGTLLQETLPTPRRPDSGGPNPPQDPSGKGGNGGGGGSRLDLSICSIVRDEAANLDGLLASIPLTRVEWIVVDTGSRDTTVETLLQAGIPTHHFSWCDDFSAARNASLKLAQRGWILWLDADDRLDEDFWDALAPLLEGPKRAYRFLVRSPREQSRGDCFRQIRLFPNQFGVEFEGRIHEQLGTSLQKLQIPIAQTDLEVLHLGYDTAAKRGAKLKRNRALLEIERVQHPKDPAVIMEFGNCLYQSAEYAEAKAVYLTLLPSTDPSCCGEAPIDEVLRHFPALIAETSLKLNQEKDAGEWFRLAVAWNPSDIKPLYWLGRKALETNNIHGALEYFYAAIDRPVTVGRVATDNYTVRRNALALVVLCEMQLFGAEKAPRGRECLRELMAGGMQEFPLDPRVPWEFLRESGNDADAERYARAYLEVAPGNIPMWEDLLEFLFTSKRYSDVLVTFADHPNLRQRSGVLEAFRAKCGENAGQGIEQIYAVYRDALRKFPEDPTLLVYFSEFVNNNRLYDRCYTDLKAIARPTGTVREFLSQIEALGYGKSDAA